jgi:hypothetical protein
VIPSGTRRLSALAEICDGGSRSDAARIGGVGLQIVRDWVPFQCQRCRWSLERQGARRVPRPQPATRDVVRLVAERSRPMGLPGVSGLERRGLFSISGYGGEAFSAPESDAGIPDSGRNGSSQESGGIRLLILGDKHLSISNTQHANNIY